MRNSLEQYQSAIETSAFLAKNGNQKLSRDLIVETLMRIDLDIEQSPCNSEDEKRKIEEIKSKLTQQYFSTIKVQRTQYLNDYYHFVAKCMIVLLLFSVFSLAGVAGIAFISKRYLSSYIANTINSTISSVLTPINSVVSGKINDTKNIVSYVLSNPETLTQLYAFYDKNPDYFFKLSDRYLDEGNFDYTKKLIQRALIIDPLNKKYIAHLNTIEKDSEYFFIRANQLEKNGKYEKAILFMNKAIDISPSNKKYKQRLKFLSSKIEKEKEGTL
ncbi:MAG: tetratricopeptide repeat protein [Oligoflexales bacterium]|nr:tetratricopeptide repeat protein [Oligoflexales bacterium]